LVFRDPINGLYTTNASAPLGVRAGLRPVYKFGLYGYCAYVDTKGGICGNATTAERFQPYRTITSDMSRNYSQFTDAIVLNTTFRSDAYLGSSSHAAYYMVLLGTICAALATFVYVVSLHRLPAAHIPCSSGLYKHTLTFLISAILAIVGTLFLLVGAAIWTVVIKKAQSINSFLAGSGSNTVPLGVNLTVGSALFLLWAAFACLLGSVIPYMLRCARHPQLEAYAHASFLIAAVHSEDDVFRPSVLVMNVHVGFTRIGHTLRQHVYAMLCTNFTVLDFLPRGRSFTQRDGTMCQIARLQFPSFEGCDWITYHRYMCQSPYELHRLHSLPTARAPNWRR
jgi:hypothetical protein